MAEAPNETKPEMADAPHDHAENDHEHQHAPSLNPECTRELVIDVPAEEVTKTWRSVAAGYRKHAKIPGFRAGKVPESVVLRRFAAEIRKEVRDALLPERLNKAVADLGLRPVGQAQITELTIEESAPLHAKAVFEYLPTFSIDGYKDVKVEKPSVEITEEEFQRRDRTAPRVPRRYRACGRGPCPAGWRLGRDQLQGRNPAKSLRSPGRSRASPAEAALEAAAAAQPITGENSLVEIGGKDTVEAFSNALRGAKPGQELKAEIIYPADYAEPKLAGKTVAYEIEVKTIKKRTLPELNDDFAKEMGHYESYADLVARMREYLVARKRQSVESATKDRLFAALAERFTFPVPESLVQEQIDARLEQGLRALAAQGMTPEHMRNLDFNRLRASQRSNAVAEVKTQILVDRIADEENIVVSNEEMDNELQHAAVQSREPLDALKARLTQEGGMARIREHLRREKTAAVLYERLPE